MKKWMISLLFLFTVLALISFAFLPVLASTLQDARVEKAVSQSPLHSIAPYISEKGSGLSVSDKLKILQQSENSPIAPAMASMDEQQVHAAVESALQPYIEAGIVEAFDSPEFQATPIVAISWQDVSHWFIFWNVRLVDVSNDAQRSLYVTVDDETGTFLLMQYFDPFAVEAGQLWEEICLPLNLFSLIYLEQAGLLDRAQAVTSSPESQQIQGMYPAQRIAAYEIHDGAENPPCIYFALSDYGEFSMWLESMPQ